MEQKRRNIGYLEPGILVVGNVRQTGCTTYQHTDHTEQRNGAEVDAEWKTRKHVQDADEEKTLAQTRSDLAARVGKLGTHLANFGFLVPLRRVDELEQTLREIRAEIRTYNEGARYTRLASAFAMFAIESNDSRVATALYNRAIDLLTDATEAIQKGDIKGLRNAIGQCVGLDSILPKDTGRRINTLIDKARTRAKEAVKAAKESARDLETIARDYLQTLEVDGLRAELVETRDAAEQDAEAAPILPETDARDLEPMAQAPTPEPADDTDDDEPEPPTPPPAPREIEAAPEPRPEPEPAAVAYRELETQDLFAPAVA